jgi:ribosomal-protein-alanine N-acetyltransferase
MDVDDLQNLRNHPVVLNHIKRDVINNKNITKSYITDKQNEIENGNIYYWAISTLDNPKLIGTICLWNFNSTKTVAEIGYELHPTYHRTGLMSEAIDAVLEFGYESLNLTSIEAYTNRYNEPSKKILSKFEFNLDANRTDEGFPDNLIYTKHHA